MSTWSLPGYEVQHLLGSGATGEVWQARELATGDLVALKRTRAGVDPAPLRRQAELLSGLDTPYVVRLRGVVEEVLVLDLAAGGSLAALLSRRGCLEPGEVVTVGAPLAGALAAVHAAGLVHGDVSAANVLFTADGMPLLADLEGPAGQEVRGTAEYVDPVVARGGPPDPAADVWSLAALCHHLLAGTPPHEGGSSAAVLARAAGGSRAPLGLLAPSAPRALVAVVEAGLSDDPAARPTAEAFAVALQRAQAPQAVRLDGAPAPAAPVPDARETHAVPRPAPPPGAPRHRRRLPVAPLAGAAAVLVLLVAGLFWARSAGGPSAQALPAVAPTVAAVPATPAPSASPPPPAPTLPPPEPSAPDWATVLAGLDGVRERAFSTAEPGVLDDVYVPGSAVRAADGSAVQVLAASGRTATGVRHVLRQVAQTAYARDRVELRVVDVLGPQTVRDAAGTVVQTRPGRGEATYDVVLVRQGQRWLIADLRPV